MKLEGIYTPVVTPHLADGAFDFDALADVVEHLVANGVHGVISGGSTAENYSQTVEERLELALRVGADELVHHPGVLEKLHRGQTADA